MGLNTVLGLDTVAQSDYEYILYSTKYKLSFEVTDL